VLECVVNLSEGRDEALVDRLVASAGACALDVHSDVDHHRSVVTLAGADDDVEAGVRRLATAAVTSIDLGRHEGAHPRVGVIDVVPWIALTRRPDGRLVDGPPALAVGPRDRFATWAGAVLDLPAFLYGPARPGPAAGEAPAPSGWAATLPELRRRAWQGLRPAFGPDTPHPTAGAVCVGARRLLVAYNLWLGDADVATARRIASEVRRPGLRTLGLEVGDAVQVSCNLVDPLRIGPADAFDAVASRVAVDRAELVGLAPAAVLDQVPSRRWAELDLDPTRTIEARLERRASTGEAW
jgi:glutamate formiminotransferase